METIRIPIGEDEIFVHLEPTMQGMRASGILFDAEGDEVTSTESRHFIGYCRNEILDSIARKLSAYTERQFSDDAFPCTCQD